MTEEIFDVVDPCDLVIAQASRSQVHRERLLHRAVHIFLFNRQGEVFLQKRSATKDMHPLHWDSSASGHLDSGENYHTAAYRESREELGLRGTILEPLLYLKAQPITGYEFLWLYRGFSEGPFVLHPQEIETGDWFAPESVLDPSKGGPSPLSPCFEFVWRQFCAGVFSQILSADRKFSTISPANLGSIQ
jgi:isopentenyldiphosphate isomerase